MVYLWKVNILIFTYRTNRCGKWLKHTSRLVVCLLLVYACFFLGNVNQTIDNKTHKRRNLITKINSTQLTSKDTVWSSGHSSRPTHCKTPSIVQLADHLKLSAEFTCFKNVQEKMTTCACTCCSRASTWNGALRNGPDLSKCRGLSVSFSGWSGVSFTSRQTDHVSGHLGQQFNAGLSRPLYTE